MPTTYCKDHDWEDNDNVCFDLKNMFDASSESMSDDINYTTTKSGFEEVKTLNYVDPTILEGDKIYMLVDHEKKDNCDRYIIEFVHDTAENYYERGKYGSRNLYVTKTPLFI